MLDLNKVSIVKRADAILRSIRQRVTAIDGRILKVEQSLADLETSLDGAIKQLHELQIVEDAAAWPVRLTSEDQL